MPAASALAVTGKFAYVESATLPNDAVAEINLEDITVEAGEPRVIASQSIRMEDKHPPIPFDVEYQADGGQQMLNYTGFP